MLNTIQNLSGKGSDVGYSPLIFSVPSQTTGTFNLVKSIANFPIILINFGSNSNATFQTAVITSLSIKFGNWNYGTDRFAIKCSDNSVIRGTISTDTSITIDENPSNLAIQNIVGIRLPLNL